MSKDSGTVVRGEKALLAAEFGEVEYMEELIAEGLDVYAAMYAGARYGRFDIVELCTAEGAELDGDVVLMSMESRDLEFFRTLVGRLDPSDVEDCVDQCMQHASRIGWAEGVRECIEMGAGCIVGSAALAAGAGHIDVLSVLGEHGGFGDDGWGTVVSAAVRSGRKDVVRYLGEDDWSSLNDEAMSEAALLGDVEMVKLLSSFEYFDVDIVAWEAVTFGKEKVLKWCLDNEADPYSTSVYAKEVGDHKCVAVCRAFWHHTGVTWDEIHRDLPLHSHKMRYFRNLGRELMPAAWHPSRVLDWCIDIEELGALEECFARDEEVERSKGITPPINEQHRGGYVNE